MLELLIQHQQCNLNEFELAKKTRWPPSLQQRFSKCSFLYKKIRDRARHYQGASEDEHMCCAAVAMDLKSRK